MSHFDKAAELLTKLAGVEKGADPAVLAAAAQAHALLSLVEVVEVLIAQPPAEPAPAAPFEQTREGWNW